MQLGTALNSLTKVAIFAGIVYVVLHWKDLGLVGDDVQAFAERACVSAVQERYDVSRVNAYAFNKNSNGYVVRATATLNKGGSAKISCLASEHGGVRDIVISE